VILKLSGVDDLTAADRLKWAKIKIPPSLALPLGEDEYYERDLIGMSVIDENGAEIGELRSVLKTGANDVYCVNGEAGEILIPAIKQCVEKVDTAGRKMTVRLMPGMLPVKKK
jgi:16S rRNA processing protein RimM